MNIIIEFEDQNAEKSYIIYDYEQEKTFLLNLDSVFIEELNNLQDVTQILFDSTKINHIENDFIDPIIKDILETYWNNNDIRYAFHLLQELYNLK